MTKSHFVLDAHKLAYHPDRVADLLAGRDVRPLYAEISPTANCNHRCLFCNFNYLGHKGIFPRGRMPELVRELTEAGVKAIVFAGAGEPTLHPDTFDAVKAAHEAGVDVAMSTNGALLTPDMIGIMAETLTWVRFSISGGTPTSYARVHGCAGSDLAKVLGNVTLVRTTRERLGTATTIGAQCVLVPENHRDVWDLAATLKKRGADYFVIKHFYSHDENAYTPDMSFRTDAYLQELEDMARELTDDGFACIVRGTGTLARSRPYTTCLGLPFILFIREDGELYTCFSHQEDQGTSLGNIGKTPFADIWNGPRKTQVFEHIGSRIDKNMCQSNCRHHQINLWLNDICNPPAHVNFI